MQIGAKQKRILQQASKRELILAGIIFSLGIIAASMFTMERFDDRPIIRALQIELSGGSAYGPDMERLFHQIYPEPFSTAGFAYPLPAMWLALPVVVFPDFAQDHVWTLLTIVVVLIGLYLHNMPPGMLFYLPLMEGVMYRQVTPLLVGLLLIGMWALEHKRWWLTGMMVALTIAAKPQATLLLSSAIAILAIYRGGGKQIVLCGAIVALPTFALEPTWVQQWLVAVTRFQELIQRDTSWQLAPIALLLWSRGHRWGAAAVLQHTLFFNGHFWYGVGVLLVAYTRLREGMVLWIILISSWTLYGIRAVSVEIYLLPMWVILGLPCFLPLAWYALREPRTPSLEPDVAQKG